MAFRYSPKIVTDGLVLYLDAANTKSYVSGSTLWNDLSIGGNNGRLTNGPTFTSSNGGAIVFDSTDDMVIVPNNSNLNLCSITNWTISVWIKLTDNTGAYNCIIAQWPQGADDAWLLAHSNGTVGFVWAPFTVSVYMFSSNTPLVVGNWTHIVLVKNGSNFTLYQNLSIVGSATNSSTKSSNYQIEIGRYGGNSNYIGAQYSNIIIQHKALSQDEILQNYNATKSRFGLT